MVSIRLDLPDPLGPIRTFNDCNSSSGMPGPKERILRAYGPQEWLVPNQEASGTAFLGRLAKLRA